MSTYEVPIIGVPTHCTLCGKTEVITVAQADYDRWKGGEYVQVAFPEMPKERREQLISGTCPTCWERMFGGEND